MKKQNISFRDPGDENEEDGLDGATSDAPSEGDTNGEGAGELVD